MHPLPSFYKNNILHVAFPGWDEVQERDCGKSSWEAALWRGLSGQLELRRPQLDLTIFHSVENGCFLLWLFVLPSSCVQS